MAKFIHSVLQPTVAVAADGQIAYDLPVNPLSALLISLQPLNETSTIANYGCYGPLLSAMDNLNVAYKGNSILNLSGPDLGQLLPMVYDIYAGQANKADIDNERRALTLVVPFGRKLYDPAECIPRTKRGELQALITWDIADTGFDGLQIELETIELPEATPERVLKITTLTRTFAATGDNDVDLPIGNLLRGIFLFGTTAFTGAVPAPTLSQIRLLRDNMEMYYASTRFETSRAIIKALGSSYSDDIDHLHAADAAGLAQVDTDQPMDRLNLQRNYTYLDLDPTRDDLYTMDTKGASRLHLRINAGTANLCRVLPIESVLNSEFFGNGAMT